MSIVVNQQRTDGTASSVYALLTKPDTDMDTLLTRSVALQKSIEAARLKARKSITTEISMLDTKIQSLSTRDPLSDDARDLLLTLRTRLAVLTNKYSEMITPSLDSINTHIAWINSTYKPFVEAVFSYSKVFVSDKPAFGGESVFTVDTTTSSFVADQCIHLHISKLRAQSPEDKTRWADLLGHRIIRRVGLYVNKTLIDEYNGELYNNYFETHVPVDKKKAWLQCVGHELPMEAELMQDPVSLDYKEKRWICNGLQTLKYEHDEFELFIPLLFWFNVDRRDAIYFPKDSTVEVRVSFEVENKLMTCVDIEADIYHERYVTPYIIDCDLYTNHIFVNREVEELFIQRLGFRLIRLHKIAEVMLDKNHGAIDLDPYIKFAVEDVTVYARPVDNEDSVDSLNMWWRNSKVSYQKIQTPVMFKEIATNSYQFGYNSIKLYEPSPLFTMVNFSFDEVSPYGEDSHLFYSGFMPLMSKDVVCGDNNVYHIAYGLWGKQYQPMGYVNLSKTRRIVFEYLSDNIESVAPVKLYVHATAINFLVYDNTSASISFSV